MGMVATGLALALVACLVFAFFMFRLLRDQAEAMRHALAVVSAEAAVGEASAGDRSKDPHATTLHTGSFAALRDLVWALDAQGLAGDWVEVGAWRGGVSAAALAAMQSSPKLPAHQAIRRRLLLCDLWEGGDPDLGPAHPPLAAMANADPAHPVVYLKGPAEVTLPESGAALALAWVDVDSAPATAACLARGVLPLLVRGGVVAVPLRSAAAVKAAVAVLGEPAATLGDLALVWRVG